MLGLNLTSNSAPSTKRKYRKKMKKQAGFTNRKYIALFIVICCFTIYNLSQPKSVSLSVNGNLRGGNDSNVWIPPMAQPFNENSLLSNTDMSHLIVVAGHSVIVGGNLKDAGTDENIWYLLDYQKGKGLPQLIVSHIKAGIAEASKDPNSLLVFSGGDTRAAIGPVDEGGSYYRVADALNLWGGKDSHVRARTITEEFATDSFQNLLFSICRFKELTSVYPTKITLISYSFKRARFEEMHAPALHIPHQHFYFVGVDPPKSSGFDYTEASIAEKTNAATLFETDPYGCNSELLQTKRKERNPFMRTPWYDLTCPDMKELMHWCGPGIYPKENVPWAE